MKIDAKSLIIIVLIGLLFSIVGYLLGSSGSTSSDQQYALPADSKVAKDYKREEIVKTIRDNAKDIQKCYLDYLKIEREQKEGTITVLFLLNEDGSVSKSSVIKNEFSDDEFGQCAAQKIASYHFAPPPLGINRNISHDLAFMTQETAEAMAKERAEQRAMPKVLPVGPE